MLISDMAHSYLLLVDQSLLRKYSCLLLQYMRLVYYEDKLVLYLFLCNIVMWKDKIVLSSGCLGSDAGLVCEERIFFFFVFCHHEIDCRHTGLLSTDINKLGHGDWKFAMEEY